MPHLSALFITNVELQQPLGHDQKFSVFLTNVIDMLDWCLAMVIFALFSVTFAVASCDTVSNLQLVTF